MLATIALAAFLAFCLSPYRRPILGPDPGGPDPDPDPIRRKISDPMPGITARIFAMFGGIAAGLAVHYLLPSEGLTVVAFAAWAGGTLVFDTVGRFAGRNI